MAVGYHKTKNSETGQGTKNRYQQGTIGLIVGQIPPRREKSSLPERKDNPLDHR